jgi:type I restriction enzyme R subunit
MKTDTSEKGLEALIVAGMTGHAALLAPGEGSQAPVSSGAWLAGDPAAYDRAWTVDLVQLDAFIAATQPPLVTALDLPHDSPTRQKFLSRLQGEVGKRGVIDVTRHGIKHGQHDVDLFYGTPSPGNQKAAQRFAQIGFPSRASFATAATTPPMHSTWRCSSTGCPSRRSS